MTRINKLICTALDKCTHKADTCFFFPAEEDGIPKKLRKNIHKWTDVCLLVKAQIIPNPSNSG